MRSIAVAGMLVSLPILVLDGKPPDLDFTPDGQEDSAVIARAQLAASASLVGNARQIYSSFRHTKAAPFLFVARCSYEWSVDWVVWIAGDDGHLEAGAFCPGLPPDKQWLGVFATKGTRQYELLRDFHRRAATLLASPPQNTEERPARGMRHDNYIVASGGDPQEVDFHEPDIAAENQGGRAASLSIEIIRYLQIARSKSGINPEAASLPDDSHGILTLVEATMKRHNRPAITALEDGQVCAILANGRHFDYLEVVVPVNRDYVIVTFAPVRSTAHTVVLKKPANSGSAFPSEEIRSLLAATTKAFGANLAAETATRMSADRELFLIARKQDGKVSCFSRCNTDLDPPEPELRQVLERLRVIGAALEQPPELNPRANQ